MTDKPDIDPTKYFLIRYDAESDSIVDRKEVDQATFERERDDTPLSNFKVSNHLQTTLDGLPKAAMKKVILI